MYKEYSEEVKNQLVDRIISTVSHYDLKRIIRFCEEQHIGLITTEDEDGKVYLIPLSAISDRINEEGK